MLREEDYEGGLGRTALRCMEETGEMGDVPEVPPAQNEAYQSYIVRYNQNVHGTVEYESDATFQIVNELFGIIYIPAGKEQEPELNSYSYSSVPKCYTYMDQGSQNASGVSRLHEHPYLKLRGAGTVVAVIDSGIDYRHPAFRDGNRSKILSIWDQSLPGGASEYSPFGQVFGKEEISRALESEDPLAVVPSVDENGHGTMLAGAAAGRKIPAENFSGAAPEAELIVVKLKQAKRYLREFYLVPEEAEVYQEDDIMLAVSFAVKCAMRHRKPLSVCIGLGSSQGAHRGDGPLSQFISSTANFSQNSVSVAAGNEGTARHHYLGNIRPGETRDTVELRVGAPEAERGFSMEFWGDAPNFYNLTIQSPTGERLAVSSALKYGTQELSFVFVETRVLVNYVPIERRSGNTLVFFRFLHPAEGIWKLEAEGRLNGSAGFHVWLPVRGMISDETFFLESSPDNTVTSPGDAADGMTATAYRYRDDSLYVRASRGYNTDGVVKPDFAAPGVDIRTVQAGRAGGYGTASGSSLAAAQTAGIAALLFEWAVIRGNEPFFSGGSVKHYLRRGAVREEELSYPNREWGYGRVDLYHTFELLT